MRNFKLAVFSLFISVFVLLSIAGAALAQGVNDFVINSFDATYELNNDDPQGKLITTEKISVDFSGQNHGILRAIPTRYKDQDTNPKIISIIRDGNTEPFITYTDNENLVVKIGDPSRKITGKHSYVIDYSVKNVITFYDKYDELFWDINGNQWMQPFNSVSADVVYTEARTNSKDGKCYTGKIGSKEQDCDIEVNTNSVKVKTTKKLQAGETLSLVVAFDKGYFTPLSWWERNWKTVVGIGIVLLELAILRRAYEKWQKYGKDYKSRGITVPYFGRPKHVSVMQAAYVAKNRLTPQDLTASIIDLAIRGHIKIHETNDKKPKHELEFIGKVDEKLSLDEEKLLKGLFGTLETGRRVKLEDKKQKLSSTLADLSNMVDGQTKEKGYYEVSPKSIFKLYWSEFLLSFVVIILGLISSSFIGVVGKLIGFVVFAVMILLGLLMTKRSQEGEMLKEHMKGLDLYLKTAEKERLAAHDAVNAPLTPRGNEPVRDVKFFEKLLPFAVVYGVEKTWAKAFANIYQQPPDWYNGQWSTFNTVALASSISSTNKVTSTAFSSPSSSGGSGFSGGAGGGGGGGGGGGW